MTLHRVLAEAAEAGVTHAAMEASSHGLDQRRLDGVLAGGGGVHQLHARTTSTTTATFEAYFEAKMRAVPRGAARGRRSRSSTSTTRAGDGDRGASPSARGQDVVTVGTGTRARALRLLGQRFEPGGQDIRFDWQGRARQARLELIGGFQAENVLVAAGLCIGAGEEPEAVFEALPRLAGVRGRMQLAARAARTGRRSSWTTPTRRTRWRRRSRRCGRTSWGGSSSSSAPAATATGGKRPLMGAAAAEGADLVIVTDDNPRSEDPAAIRAAVLAGRRADATSRSATGPRRSCAGVDALGRATRC